MGKSQADLLRGTEIRAAESQPEGSVDKTAQGTQCQSTPNSIHGRSWTVRVLHGSVSGSLQGSLGPEEQEPMLSPTLQSSAPAWW